MKTAYTYTPGGTHSGFNVRNEKGHTVAIAHDKTHAELFAQAPTLYDLLCEALPMVEETDPDPALYKPGYVRDLVKRIKAAIQGASV
jgi:hypothetical protein